MIGLFVLFLYIKWCVSPLRAPTPSCTVHDGHRSTTPTLQHYLTETLMILTSSTGISSSLMTFVLPIS